MESCGAGDAWEVEIKGVLAVQAWTGGGSSKTTTRRKSEEGIIKVAIRQAVFFLTLLFHLSDRSLPHRGRR